MAEWSERDKKLQAVRAYFDKWVETADMEDDFVGTPKSEAAYQEGLRKLLNDDVVKTRSFSRVSESDR